MITVFGSINLDLVTRVARLPRPGETVPGEDALLVPGGKGANQALAARRAGASVRMAGAVGADAFAETALSLIRESGVDLAAVLTVDRPTGLASITVDSSGENVIVLSPGANARVTEASAAALTLAPGDTLLLQMEVATAASLAAASRARAAGARTVLSLAPFRPMPADSFAPLSMLIVNETEAADLAAQLGLASGDAGETVRGLARRLGPAVVATLGPRGAVAAAPSGEVVAVPALPVTPVDTTGAGDTFAGVLGAALDAGLPLEPAMRRAAIAGSLACTKVGAQLSMPIAAEIDRALAGFAS